MNRNLPDLHNTDELLREWAHFFRDRRKFEHCRSIEHRFRATSDDFGPSGWGDNEAAPAQRGPSWSLLRAFSTQDLLDRIPLESRWAITFAYCYPNLPRTIVLRLMKKWAKRRLNWKSYLDILDIGRMRVHTATFSRPLPVAFAA